MSNKLHLTVVIDTLTPPEWVTTTLEQLNKNQRIQLDCIIVKPSKELPKKPSKTRWHRLAYKLLYGFMNRPRFALEPCTPHTLPAAFKQLVSNGESSTSPDVLLHLGHYDQHDHALPSATHGTWIVKHEALSTRVEEAMLARHTLLWIHLYKIDGKQSDSIERISSHALPMQTYAITDVISAAFGSLPVLISSRLNWLANGCSSENVYEAEPVEISNMSGIECLARTLFLLYLLIEQRVRNKVQIEQWQLAFLASDVHIAESKLNEYVALTPPPDHIWADPQLIVENNQTHVFFEELEVKENHGRIAWAVLTTEGLANEPKIVLSEVHHLSYPFVFKHESEIYMVPETASERTISLYKATEFPEQWTRISNIMDDIDAADSTLLQHDGLWWLFTNGTSYPSVDERDQLNIFYAQDFLSGDWQPHPLNPVVTGVDRARMAGKIYRKDGELFRPSQYGAKRYGFGNNTSRIDLLSTTHYQETLIKRLTPHRSDVWIGCHTASHSNNLNVIDRLRRVRR